MPRVQLTYQKDIDAEGSDIVEVSEGRAEVLLNLRRAVLLSEVSTPTKPRKKAARRRRTS